MDYRQHVSSNCKGDNKKRVTIPYSIQGTNLTHWYPREKKIIIRKSKWKFVFAPPYMNELEDSSTHQSQDQEILGISFPAVCVKCGRYRNEVRYLKVKNKDGGIDERSGPYDVVCAYSFKVDKINDFTTNISNIEEWWYRYIMKEDTPDNTGDVSRFFSRFVTSRLYWLLIIFAYVLIIFAFFYDIYVMLGVLLYSIGFYVVTYRKDDIFAIPHFENIYDDLNNNKKKNYVDITVTEFHKKYLKFSLITILYFPKLVIVFMLVVLGAPMIAIMTFMIFGVIGIFMVPFMILGGISKIAKVPGMVYRYIKNRLIFTYNFILASIFQSKKFGNNHMENFELFWNGNLNDTTPPTTVFTMYLISLIVIIPTLTFAWLSDNTALTIVRLMFQLLIVVILYTAPINIMAYLENPITLLLISIAILGIFMKLFESGLNYMYTYYKKGIRYSNLPYQVTELLSHDREITYPYNGQTSKESRVFWEEGQ